MLIVEHVWKAEIAAKIETLMIHQREFAQEQADLSGSTLAEYVALAILEYLELNHGEGLEIVRFDEN